MIHEDHPATPCPKVWNQMRCAYQTSKLKTLKKTPQLKLFNLQRNTKQFQSHGFPPTSLTSWISFDQSIHRSSLRPGPGLPWNSKASLRWFAPQSVAVVVKSPRASEPPKPAHKGEQLGTVSTKSWSRLVMQRSNIIPKQANGFDHVEFSLQAVWTAQPTGQAKALEQCGSPTSLMGRTELTANFFSQSCFGAC